MRTAGRIAVKIVAFLLLLIALYFLAAIIGSAIPVNTDADASEGEVEIFLRTNGVHTSIVTPIRNEVMDWTEITDFSHTISERTDFDYISFGWGDLEFYQNTPEWSDLTASTAFKALFLKTPSALNVEYYGAPIAVNENTVAVNIKREQYNMLCQYILNSFITDETGRAIHVEGVHYNNKDAFYLARRHMDIFYTCNTWTNNGLKNADLRACLWTPFDKGIFFQYD